MQTPAVRAALAAAGVLVVPAAVVDGAWLGVALLAVLARLVVPELLPGQRWVALAAAVVAVVAGVLGIPGAGSATLLIHLLLLLTVTLVFLPPERRSILAIVLQTVAVAVLVSSALGVQTYGHATTGGIVLVTGLIGCTGAIRPLTPSCLARRLVTALLLGTPLAALQTLQSGGPLPWWLLALVAFLAGIAGVGVIELENARAARDEVEQRGSALADAALSMVVVLDHDGVVLEANPAAEALLGSTDRPLVGQRLAPLLAAPSDRDAPGRILPVLAADLPELPTGDLAALRRLELLGSPAVATAGDGRTARVELRLARFDGVEGQRTVVVLEDVGTRVREAQRLEREVQARQRLVDELTRLDALRSGLLASASHELRTPLTIIRGTAELLLDRRDLDEEMRQSLLRRQLGQTHRLAGLVDDLLTVDPSTPVLLEPEEIDLLRVAEDVVTRWQGTHPGHRIRLSGLSTPAHLDRRAFERMLDALLDNATRYGLPPVLVQVREVGGLVLLEVHDSGSGIPDWLRGEVVSPFARGTVVDPARPGLGLGLSVVRTLAEAHGGTLRVAPAARGTLVRVELPLGVHDRAAAGDPLPRTIDLDADVASHAADGPSEAPLER